ncbi:UNVERIFIED_CONTAM: hypothetical protein GTU68_035306 [Idotea baltica]|nr:hypothetical protein [Idotea baltica]
MLLTDYIEKIGLMQKTSKFLTNVLTLISTVIIMS